MELVDYEEYIVGNGFVVEGKRQYYANWVSKFLYLQLSSRLSSVEQINQYRELLRVLDVAKSLHYIYTHKKMSLNKE